MNKIIRYAITPSGTVSGAYDGKPFLVTRRHPYYDAVLQAIQSNDGDGLLNLVDVSKSMSIATKGRCTVQNGRVFYDGKVTHNEVAKRILRLLDGGYNHEPMMRFMENVMANPSDTSRNELYLFLEKSTLPITEDGFFLAYRKVNADYTSNHANPDGTKNLNRIGDEPFMKREDVDPLRQNTCSTGLHACSLSYLTSFSGQRTMIVKINPADVVSVPPDYNEAKLRCCRYLVVGEHTAGDTIEAFCAPVYKADAKTGVAAVSPARDGKGRFTRA